MSFKFPGSDRFTGRKTAATPSVPDDLRAGIDKASKAFARVSKGRRIPEMPKGRTLSEQDRKSVAAVVEEFTGRKPKGRVNDPEVNQRLTRLFGGGGPTPVGSEGPERPPTVERPPLFRQGGGEGRSTPRW